MIRKFVPAALLAGGVFILAACSGGTANLPGGVNVEVPGVTVPSVTLPSLGDAVNVGIDAQLKASGFEPNPQNKNEYVKKGANGSGDIVLVMENGKPKSVKYDNKFLQCQPTESSILAALATGLTGGTNQQTAESLCGATN